MASSPERASSREAFCPAAVRSAARSLFSAVISRFDEFLAAVTAASSRVSLCVRLPNETCQRATDAS